MQKLSGLFLLMVLISGVFSSGFTFAQIAPVAVDDSYSTNEDTTLNISTPGIIANDTNTGGDILAIVQTNVGFGILTLNSDGSFSYQPSLNFNGFDSFTYAISNGTNNSNNATVTLSINSVNDAPIALNDTVTTPEDTPVPITLTGSDVDNDSLTFNMVTDSLHGILTGSNASLTYTPNGNYTGTDSFMFNAYDGIVNSTSATISITIGSVNDAPIALNDTASTLENTSVTILVLNNDFDVDDNLLTVNSITQGTNGTVTTNGTVVIYTPKQNFTGSDSFTYTIFDGTTIGNSASVKVTVLSINDEHDDDKVDICHKDKKTISVSGNAISAHLKHGDVLGECSSEHESEHESEQGNVHSHENNNDQGNENNNDQGNENNNDQGNENNNDQGNENNNDQGNENNNDQDD